MVYDFLKLCASSLFSAVILFALTRLMGKRQVSQLNMFDYVTGITIGSVAAEMATETDGDVFKPLAAMFVYAAVSLSISFLNNKSVKTRRFINGEPTVLMNKGKLYRKNFEKAKIDINEFLTECRTNGYFDLNMVYCAILEPNGKISFLGKTENEPASPNDFNISVEQEELFANVISDGKIQTENLKNIGKDLKWLENKLKEKNTKPSEIFLALCDINGNLNVFLKDDSKKEKDIFV